MIQGSVKRPLFVILVVAIILAAAFGGSWAMSFASHGWWMIFPAFVWGFTCGRLGGIVVLGELTGIWPWQRKR